MQRRNIGATILVWAITLVVAFGIGAAGVTKFVQPSRWEALFSSWGYPHWASAVIGLVEVAAALVLFVPRLAAYAAIVLGAVMIGAVCTLLMHPGGPFGRGVTPLVYAAMLVVVLAVRWRERLVVLKAA
jgi:putative oxidoreductase